MIFLIIALVIILLFIAVCSWITWFMFKVTYRRMSVDNEDNLLYLYDEKTRAAYPRRQISFPSGGETLAGYIYGEENDKALAVFSHGIFSGPDEYLPIITYMIDHGYRVFAYDYTAYNNSTGQSAHGLPQSALDLHAALTYIESDPELSKMKKVTFGHSWGGFASVAVLNFDHDVAAACAMSGFNDGHTVSMEASVGMMGPFLGNILSPFISVLDRIRFGRYATINAVDGINKSGIPVLITHADRDEVITYDNASIICHRAEITNPNVEYVTITEEPRNNHNDFFLTCESAAATQEFRRGYAEIEKKYGKGMPVEVPRQIRHEYYSKADKELCNRPSIEYFETVCGFFDRALEK
ncbi:MAG: lysophospholipase [Lachnospiraceae bacterium]|nr:lysophospholipase [Lachnospiraceae bacterium]